LEPYKTFGSWLAALALSVVEIVAGGQNRDIFKEQKALPNRAVDTDFPKPAFGYPN
jgi:hypothetical protein